MNVSKLDLDDQLDLACDMLYHSNYRESDQDVQYDFLTNKGFDDDVVVIAVEEFNS